MFSKRYLLLALVVCVVLYAASRSAQRITPALREVGVAAEGSFTRDGQYPGEPFANAAKVRGWGSWSGSDENEGTLALGPFAAPRVLRFGVGGYPDHAGNELFAERVDTGARLAIPVGAVGERWRVVDFKLPPAWREKPIRLLAIDHAHGLGGWLAITEPVRGGRSDGNNALLESLAAWAINGALLGLIYFAAARWLGAKEILPPEWIPLGAGAVVALCGYGVFWAFFANSLLGKIVAWALLAAGAFFSWWPRTLPAQPAPDLATPTKLLLAIGAFYLALLHLFPTSLDFYSLAANRYRENLPVDNVLSHALAERLFAGEPARRDSDEWRSSDRPPLQTGWQLLTWPAAKLISLDRATASATAAVWFQLLWVTAAYGLLRTLGLASGRAAAWVAVCALSGFFVQNTVFTWPKLAAGAFACGAFGLLLVPRSRDSSAVGDLRTPSNAARTRPEGAFHLLAFGVFAALGWLAHGGVAFSFIALLPWLVMRVRHGGARPWLAAAAVALLLVLPWFAYQRFYDPPGDRLLKWHLAGQEARNDSVNAWHAIRESYAAQPWREIAATKMHHLRDQLEGDFPGMFRVSREGAAARRETEFFNTARALTWWPLLALVAWVSTRRKIFANDGANLAALLGWIGLTLAVWCLAMFKPHQAVIHHGSYALMIALFAACCVVLERAGRGWLLALAALQAITFVATWTPGNGTIRGDTVGLPALLVLAVPLGWFVLAGLRRGAGVAPVSEMPPGHDARATSKFLAWWQNPQLNVWVLLALAVLLFLRKPHALHTAQLWAEDGSIFLMQNDAHGVAAWWIPYMGYLHLLPRLIAWAASHLLDPAWWPTFYNGVAFAIWLGVLARLFSPRLDLPGKPWLALAFILGPNTGEVLFNITNLQWLTAFVLVQQVLIAPPANPAQRWGDLLGVVLAALTGPFVIVFAPLFAWRWWRDRRRDNLALLLIVAACAAVQAWFVVRTGPKFDYQSAPFHLGATINVIGRRLLIWPLLGDKLARALPPPLIGAIGGAFIAALLGWSLRPGPRREMRATIVAAFALILLAGAYRTRPDTWADDNLVYADRYFYIPRVLFAWLLVFEFAATPRAIAVIARLTCLMAVVVHLRDYQISAPPDYHWRDHVEPIRRGVPADIPTLPENWTLEYRGRPGVK